MEGLISNDMGRRIIVLISIIGFEPCRDAYLLLSKDREKEMIKYMLLGTLLNTPRSSHFLEEPL